MALKDWSCICTQNSTSDVHCNVEDLGPGVRLQDLSEDDMDGSDISSGEIGGGAAGGAESAETYPALDSLLQ